MKRQLATLTHIFIVKNNNIEITCYSEKKLLSHKVFLMFLELLNAIAKRVCLLLLNILMSCYTLKTYFGEQEANC